MILSMRNKVQESEESCNKEIFDPKDHKIKYYFWTGIYFTTFIIQQELS